MELPVVKARKVGFDGCFGIEQEPNTLSRQKEDDEATTRCIVITTTAACGNEIFPKDPTSPFRNEVSESFPSHHD